MTEIWLDYSFARPNLAVAKRAGAVGVIRYVCPVNNLTAGKILDLPELAAIEAAGLDYSIGFEWYAERALEGYAAGLADGRTTLHMAQHLGYAHGASVYPAHDTGARDDPQVAEYLRGFAAGLGGYYVLGIYSGIDTVDAMLGGRHAVKGWQTGAWSGGRVSSRAVLFQNLQQWFHGAADVNVVLRGQVGSHRQTLAAAAHPVPAPAPHPVRSPRPRKPVRSPKPIPAGGTYKVRAGDTLEAIANRHGTTVPVLTRINGLRDPNVIRVGQVLHLPGPARKPPKRPGRRPVRKITRKSNQVVVRPGDTLSAVAARVGSTWRKLQAVNHLSNVNLIYPGQVLRIK
jgi:LysM repeat protein